MKITIANEKKIDLYQELNTLVHEDITVFFKMDVATNIRTLELQIKALQMATDINTIEGFKEYQKDIRDSFMTLADERGRVSEENMPALQKIEWEVNQRHEETRKRIEQFEEEKKALLAEEVVIEGLIPLSITRFPKGTKVDILKLYDIITDNRGGEECTEQQATDIKQTQQQANDHT